MMVYHQYSLNTHDSSICNVHIIIMCIAIKQKLTYVTLQRRRGGIAKGKGTRNSDSDLIYKVQ